MKFDCFGFTERFPYSDVIMSAMASQITGARLFTQPFVQAQINENVKTPRQWPLWGGSPVNSPQKGPVTRKMFPFDDAIVSRSAGQILAQYHHSDIQPRDFEVTGDLEIRRPIAKSYVRNICLLALGWHKSCVTMPIAWLDEAANLGWRR